MTKLQILCLGSPKTGKTTLCNHLADLQPTLQNSAYHPTQGVRILEIERIIKNTRVNVELWDCSGDERLMSVWKSQTGVKGVVLVTNGADLSGYLDSLPKLDSKQIVIFVNKIDGTASKFKTSMADVLTFR